MAFSQKKKGKGRTRRKPGEMSKAELAYLAHLEAQLAAGEILGFRYEAVKLRLADNTWFTPDFFVMTLDRGMELHEVKAGTKRGGKVVPYMKEDAWMKLKIASELWHEYTFRLCFQHPQNMGGQWEIREL